MDKTTEEALRELQRLPRQEVEEDLNYVPPTPKEEQELQELAKKSFEALMRFSATPTTK